MIDQIARLTLKPAVRELVEEEMRRHLDFTQTVQAIREVEARLDRQFTLANDRVEDQRRRLDDSIARMQEMVTEYETSLEAHRQVRAQLDAQLAEEALRRDGLVSSHQWRQRLRYICAFFPNLRATVSGADLQLLFGLLPNDIIEDVFGGIGAPPSSAALRLVCAEFEGVEGAEREAVIRFSRQLRAAYRDLKLAPGAPVHLQ